MIEKGKLEQRRQTRRRGIEERHAGKVRDVTLWRGGRSRQNGAVNSGCERAVVRGNIGDEESAVAREDGREIGESPQIVYEGSAHWVVSCKRESTVASLRYISLSLSIVK
jgi:hypothetical protein